MGIVRMKLPYPTRLPVTPEIARAVIDYPYTTVADLDALIASIGNAPNMGVAHPLYREALDKQAEMAMEEYHA
jgi:hypothetical protein